MEVPSWSTKRFSKAHAPVSARTARPARCATARPAATRSPAPAQKAPGNGFTRNYDAWQKICVNMDTICPNEPVDTAVELFGTMYRYPFFAAPLGAMKMHYGDKYNDREYNSILVNACADSGIAAFTGDGVDAAVFQGAMEAIRAAGGVGVPTIKPWSQQLVFEKLDLARTSGCKAVAMDIDGAGLPFLKNLTPPAGSKSVQELTEIIRYAAMPFIVKGVMTVRGAQKAAEAGAAAIIVSNHGGRVLGQTPASAEVLAEIADAVGGSMKIFVDGGIRTGTDVFKALALGADAVLIGRPFVPMVYGDGAQGVATYIEKRSAASCATRWPCAACTRSARSRATACVCSEAKQHTKTEGPAPSVFFSVSQSSQTMVAK